MKYGQLQKRLQQLLESGLLEIPEDWLRRRPILEVVPEGDAVRVLIDDVVSTPEFILPDGWSVERQGEYFLLTGEGRADLFVKLSTQKAYWRDKLARNIALDHARWQRDGLFVIPRDNRRSAFPLLSERIIPLMKRDDFAQVHAVEGEETANFGYYGLVEPEKPLSHMCEWAWEEFQPYKMMRLKFHHSRPLLLVRPELVKKLGQSMLRGMLCNIRLRYVQPDVYVLVPEKGYYTYPLFVTARIERQWTEVSNWRQLREELRDVLYFDRASRTLHAPNRPARGSLLVLSLQAGEEVDIEVDWARGDGPHFFRLVGGEPVIERY